MERERPRIPPQPSVEEQVNRVISAGEQARQRAGDELERAADKAESSVSSMAQQAADKARTVANNMQSKDMDQAATDLKGKATEIASDVKDKATEIASDVKDKASDLSAQASDKASAAMTSTGERIEQLGHTVREYAPEGKVGDLATSAASALERSGSYLKEADLSDVRGDLESLIRRHPVESLLVGVGVGFLVARALRR